MKQIQDGHMWYKFIIISVLVITCSMALTAPALAQFNEPDQDAVPMESAERLEALYQRQLDMLTKQEVRLEKADEVASKLEDAIQLKKDEGVDTSAVEAALTNFRDEIVKAEKSYTAAQNILENSSGFDENGRVTDAKAALETLRTAAIEQRQFHLTLSNAARDLRIAIQDSYAAHRLENVFAKQKVSQDMQGQRLSNVDEVKARLEHFILEEQDKGRDTSILEDALNAFNTSIKSAASDHERAEKLLNARAGFDSNGQVTDEVEARETVKEIGESQRGFHLTASQAVADLRHSICSYRQQWFDG